MRGKVELFEYVFQGQYLIRFRMEKIHKGRNEFFLFHSLAGFFFFVFGHNILIIEWIAYDRYKENNFFANLLCFCLEKNGDVGKKDIISLNNS